MDAAPNLPAQPHPAPPAYELHYARIGDEGRFVLSLYDVARDAHHDVTVTWDAEQALVSLESIATSALRAYVETDDHVSRCVSMLFALWVDSHDPQ